MKVNVAGESMSSDQFVEKIQQNKGDRCFILVIHYYEQNEKTRYEWFCAERLELFVLEASYKNQFVLLTWVLLAKKIVCTYINK